MTKWTIFDKNWKIEKNALASQKMTKLSIFDKIEESKNPWASQKMTKLSIFDKIEEAKKYTGLSQNDKIKHFWQNWRSEKIHEPLTKWQNGAFLTKIVWYITTHSVHIVYLCLSHNLKSTFQKWLNGPFLTKLKRWKKNTLSSLRKWQNWAFFTKLKKRKNTRASHKMTKSHNFDKISLIYHNT